MTFRAKLFQTRRRPALVKDILLDRLLSKVYQNEINEYFMHSMSVAPSTDYLESLRLNKLCCVEDWNNPEMKDTLSRLGYSGYIHRKDWEWCMGLIAMRRFNKLNKDSIILGVGSGKEKILFYLANDIVGHVYATDLYTQNGWAEAPREFITSPEKYSEQKYNHQNLTVMNEDGRHLSFDSNLFDVVFSFSSIEHFGGKRHSGALESVREMGRVLKPNGIAVIATEYIINNKNHYEYFNERTIYSDLIDKLENLKMVEPLDLTVTQKTIQAALNLYPDALRWGSMRDEYKRDHPHVLIKIRNMVHTSIMLVFRKIL